jgi:hypothetical protein
MLYVLNYLITFLTSSFIWFLILISLNAALHADIIFEISVIKDGRKQNKFISVRFSRFEVSNSTLNYFVHSLNFYYIVTLNWQLSIRIDRYFDNCACCRTLTREEVTRTETVGQNLRAHENM